MNDLYYNYDIIECPVCGGKIIHPHTGVLGEDFTEEDLEEELKCCIWYEVVDEGGGSLGYTPICRKSKS